MLAAVTLPFFLAGASAAEATEPIAVTYITTGTARNWVYNFSVSNSLGGTNDVYFFGVNTPNANSSGNPAAWRDWNSGQDWNNTAYGGNGTYNNPWIGDLIQPGGTLSGFLVSDSSTTAMTTINWFAFAYGDTYTTGPYLNNSRNPGFEGTAVAVSAVPSKPGLLLLFRYGPVV